MGPRQRISALRRIKLDEMVGKLSQIEEQAARTLSEYPHGLTVERQRLILGLAKQMRAHLQDQLVGGGREALPGDTEENHLHAVDAQTRTGTDQ